MTTPDNERTILRRLAEKQAAIAALPVHKVNAALWTRLNRLDRVKPMVWIIEIPWTEFSDAELQYQTTDPFCRAIERQLRRTIWQWEHFPADMVVEPVFYCPIVIRSSGFGFEVREQTIAQAGTHIRSHHYLPQIREEADVEKIRPPEIVPDWEATDQNYDRMVKLFGDILPVKKLGQTRWHFPLWDYLVQWWGVEEALTDLVERPEMVHRAMDRLMRAYLSELEQHERQGLMALNTGNTKVGSGGLGFTDQLPAPGFDPARVRARDCWGGATAQIFSGVSPAMHWEFALRYEMPILERFGLAYYGCCEPLHKKMHLLKKIPNLRKVSISPLADVAESVAALGPNYVYSLKPNPAIVAGDAWNPNAARASLRSSLEKLRGCCVEVILKDISTARGEARRLQGWAEVAAEVAAEFA